MKCHSTTIDVTHTLSISPHTLSPLSLSLSITYTQTHTHTHTCTFSVARSIVVIVETSMRVRNLESGKMDIKVLKMWLRTNDRERGRDKEKCVGWFSVGIGTKKRKRLVHQFAPLSLPLFHPSPSICLPMVVAQRKNVKSVVRWPPRRLSVVWVHHHQSQFLFKFYRGFFVGHDDAALQSQRLIRKSDFSIWKLEKSLCFDIESSDILNGYSKSDQNSSCERDWLWERSLSREKRAGKMTWYPNVKL